MRRSLFARLRYVQSLLYAILNFTAQLWRFNGDKLVNKQFATWQYSTKRWKNWSNDKEGALYDKGSSQWEQLTRWHEYYKGDGTQVSLTKHFTYPETWRKSRSITFEADPNVWFTLYNVESKRYLTASSPTSTAIWGKLYQIIDIKAY